jgi:hypothetical protein
MERLTMKKGAENADLWGSSFPQSASGQWPTKVVEYDLPQRVVKC